MMLKHEEKPSFTKIHEIVYLLFSLSVCVGVVKYVLTVDMPEDYTHTTNYCNPRFKVHLIHAHMHPLGRMNKRCQTTCIYAKYRARARGGGAYESALEQTKLVTTINIPVELSTTTHRVM